jgi:hypothetical protein
VVRENTRYQGLRWDIKLDTGWTERQVWEAVHAAWAEELEERSEPMTKLETRDERDHLAKF